jgi:hypothetical protein
MRRNNPFGFNTRMSSCILFLKSDTSSKWSRVETESITSNSLFLNGKLITSQLTNLINPDSFFDLAEDVTFNEMSMPVINDFSNSVRFINWSLPKASSYKSVFSIDLPSTFPRIFSIFSESMSALTIPVS